MKSIKNYKKLKLTKNELHIWHVDLEKQIRNLNIYWFYLSSIEKDRAQAFRFEKHKNNYIIRTGILRILLSNYMMCQPNEIEFKLGDFGKPILNNSTLKFNLSHSESKTLIAINQDTEIGIDIEFIDPKIEVKTIAANFFSKEEIRQLYTLTDENLADGFFNIWTKKEAFIKAIGKGLTYPLDAFDVSLDNTEQKTLTRLDHSFSEAKKWNLFSIKTYNNFKAAIAYKGKTKQVIYFNYT